MLATSLAEAVSQLTCRHYLVDVLSRYPISNKASFPCISTTSKEGPIEIMQGGIKGSEFWKVT